MVTKLFAAAAALMILSTCGTPPSKSGTNNGSNNGVNNGGSNNGSNNGPNNGAPSYLDPDDYGRTCEFDYDCLLVYGGDVCGCLDICPSAIAKSEGEQFTADSEAIECTSGDPVACPGAACEEMFPACASGTCEATVAYYQTPSQFDQSCELDEDCVTVRSGAICNACDCGRGAINIDAVDEYEAAVPDVDCNPGPSPCDCAAPEEAWCNGGTCDTRFR